MYNFKNYFIICIGHYTLGYTLNVLIFFRILLSRSDNPAHLDIDCTSLRKMSRSFSRFVYINNLLSFFGLRSSLATSSFTNCTDHRCGLWVTSLFLTQRARIRSPVESIPWLRFFPEFSLNRKTNVRKFGPHSSPVIIWSSCIIQTIHHPSTDGDDLWP